MAYNLFNPAKPDASADSGTVFGANTIKNFLAVRDGAVCGVMPWWNYSQSGGTASQPAQVLYKNGSEWIKLALTWGSSGGSNAKVTVTVYSYSADSGATYNTIGTETRTFDSSGNMTATVWS